MVTTTGRILALSLLVALLLGACKSAPGRAGELDLREPDAAAQAAGDYWDLRGRPPPVSGPARIAVVGFAVEIVTEKYESGGDRQAALVPPHPAILLAGAAGVGLKQVEIPEDSFAAIADAAYGLFAAELASRGIAVVEQPAALAVLPEAPRGLAPGEHDSDAQINFGATDTGRLRRLRIVPPGGYRLLDAPEAAAAEVLDAGPVERAAVVRLRLGVYRGHATVEEGSSLTFISADGDGTLRSTRSLLSADAVVHADAPGGVYRVDPHRYLAAMRRTLPIYLDMAMLAAAKD